MTTDEGGEAEDLFSSDEKQGQLLVALPAEDLEDEEEDQLLAESATADVGKEIMALLLLQ